MYIIYYLNDFKIIDVGFNILTPPPHVQHEHLMCRVSVGLYSRDTLTIETRFDIMITISFQPKTLRQ